MGNRITGLDSAEKERKRRDLQAQYDTACAKRDEYDRHYINALQAIYHLEVAQEGLEYMNTKQKDRIASQLEEGIHADNDLSEKLGLAKKNIHYEEVQTMLECLYTKAGNYKELQSSYNQKAINLNYEINKL